MNQLAGKQSIKKITMWLSVFFVLLFSNNPLAFAEDDEFYFDYDEEGTTLTEHDEQSSDQSDAGDGGWNWIPDWLQTAAGNTSDFVGDVFGDVGDFFGEVADAISNGWDDFAEWSGLDSVDSIESFIEWRGELQDSLFDWLGEQWESFVDWVNWDAVLDWISTIALVVIAAAIIIAAIGTGIGAIILIVVAAIGGAIYAGMNAGTDDFSLLDAAMWTLLPATGAGGFAARGILGGLFRSGWGGLLTGLRTVGGWISAGWGALLTLGRTVGGWISSGWGALMTVGRTVGGWFSSAWAAFRGTSFGSWLAGVFGGQGFQTLFYSGLLTGAGVEFLHMLSGDDFSISRFMTTFVTTMVAGPIGAWSWSAIRAGTMGWLQRVGIWGGFSMSSGALYTFINDGGIGTFITATLVSAALFPVFGWLGAKGASATWNGIVSAVDNFVQGKTIQWLTTQFEKAYNGFRNFVQNAGQYVGQKYNEFQLRWNNFKNNVIKNILRLIFRI